MASARMEGCSQCRKGSRLGEDSVVCSTIGAIFQVPYKSSCSEITQSQPD